jgi:hypothetical protein
MIHVVPTFIGEGTPLIAPLTFLRLARGFRSFAESGETVSSRLRWNEVASREKRRSRGNSPASSSSLWGKTS